jgi:hypothetical protein
VLVGRSVGRADGVALGTNTATAVSSGVGETIAVGAVTVCATVLVPTADAAGNDVGAGAALGLQATSTRATISSGKERFIAKVFPPGSWYDQAEFYHTSGKGAARLLKASEKHAVARMRWRAIPHEPRTPPGCIA